MMGSVLETHSPWSRIESPATVGAGRNRTGLASRVGPDKLSGRSLISHEMTTEINPPHTNAPKPPTQIGLLMKAPHTPPSPAPSSTTLPIPTPPLSPPPE